MAAKKRGRFIQWQHTKEVKRKKKYSGETSPYWDHVNAQNRPLSGREFDQPGEYPTANPDVLADPASEDTPEVDTRALMKETLRDVKLSKGEKAVLNCIGLQGFTEEKTAKVLGISRRSVRTLFLRGQKKCEKLFVAKMRHAGVYDTRDKEKDK